MAAATMVTHTTDVASSDGNENGNQLVDGRGVLCPDAFAGVKDSAAACSAAGSAV